MNNGPQKEHDDETIKAIASNAIDIVRDSRAMVINEHSASYRWLVGSLLAINGGAAIAMLGIENIPATQKLLAGGAFYVGIISALGTGVIGQFASRATILPFNKMLDYWVEVKSTAIVDVQAKELIDAELVNSAKPGVWAQVTGYASAIMFSIGIFSIGYGIAVVPSGSDRSITNQKTDVKQFRPDTGKLSK